MFSAWSDCSEIKAFLFYFGIVLKKQVEPRREDILAAKYYFTNRIENYKTKNTPR